MSERVIVYEDGRLRTHDQAAAERAIFLPLMPRPVRLCRMCGLNAAGLFNTWCDVCAWSLPWDASEGAAR